MLQDIPIAQLMSRRLTCVAPVETVQNAVNIMRNRGVSCLLVKDDGRMVGIVTERDLVTHFDALLARGLLDSASLGVVSAIMAEQPVTVHYNDSLVAALQTCLAKSIRHLPVLNDAGDLVGVVTQTDIVRAYAHILERQLALETDNERLKTLSLVDPLMGIGNRRAMERDLGHTQAAAKRTGSAYGLALLDIDWFKRYNDHYGHQMGDEALRAVAKAIAATLRQGDRLYRYGGEELMLLLPDTDEQGALQAAERARAAVQALQLPHVESPLGVLTLSGGAAAGCKEAGDSLISHADTCLYDAKEAGRNRVLLYESTAPSTT
ncbi:GGDEF domain-containing protein [Simiduia aestuariiviva]|uniref:diguanylate cyclase n=1 Tax=Simiduia aestuariiviva TaxID=1510459 RepID=A0A839UMZ3_9GAMM|nr:GGDEF domain-containing protein [Simiduia aestuariiviva]MBB3169212.1 diguanylate cyclase (GGDEF)-like protein [Simiduia aestuariiviva]